MFLVAAKERGTTCGTIAYYNRDSCRGAGLCRHLDPINVVVLGKYVRCRRHDAVHDTRSQQDELCRRQIVEGALGKGRENRGECDVS